MADALRIVEVARGVAASACGRLFAGLGDEVLKVEPEGGDDLRRQPPLNADGLGLSFVALNADKVSVVGELGEVLPGLLRDADVLLLDLLPAEADALDLDPRTLRRDWPGLVVVWITAFARDSAFADVAGDSLLAESYGGLATMIGEPTRRPLSLGGEQIAYAGAVTAFFGAQLALLRRDQGHGGDVVEVALSDVAAYADWKSDVVTFMTGAAPRRAGLKAGEWKMLRASNGWVGAIFQQQHWQAMVELIDSPVLRDPELADERTRLSRAAEWWPVVDRWAEGQTAEEIYEKAQRLGLPFGWAAKASDLAASKQLLGRDFIRRDARPDEPVVGSPVHSAGLPWRSGSAPALGGPTAPAAPTRAQRGTGGGASAPLEGVVVLDFGAITAGAAATRLLADHGATVLKVESADRPDTFRMWKMPRRAGETGAPQQDSPYFPSNNVGKRGVAIDLKTEDGRRLVHELAARSHVFVENFRVGVTERLGIDEPTLRAINPDLVYISLSSQGHEGPESRNRSFGSTLDLLSGLASVTGYDPDRPMWSSSDVNYPDQLVSLMGAAFAAHCVARGISGVTLDISQREGVSWTLAAQIADYLFNGVDSEIRGNRRPGRWPHDTYGTAEPDHWVAISCASDGERAALAACVGSDELGSRDGEWWREHQDEVDEILGAWTRARPRDEVVAALRAADVAAVPVFDAADRAKTQEFVDHLVRFPGEGTPIKGFPLRFLDYVVPINRHAPAIGEDTAVVLAQLAGASEEELARLADEGAIFLAPSIPSNQLDLVKE